MTETTAVVLGTGILNWFPGERQSDRYGSFHLEHGDGTPLDYEGLPEGTTGTLTAQVVTQRPAAHVGDWFRGIKASPAGPGTEIDLGTGVLFTERDNGWGITCVGVRPDDGRDTDWMDPAALYKVHNQEVRVTFTPAAPSA